MTKTFLIILSLNIAFIILMETIIGLLIGGTEAIIVIYDTLPFWKKAIIGILNIQFVFSPVLLSVILAYFIKKFNTLNKKTLWVLFLLFIFSCLVIYLSLFSFQLNLSPSLIRLISPLAPISYFIILASYIYCYILGIKLIKINK